MIVVIGSGPAGMAAAHALLGRGQRVTVVDAGVEMDAERRAWVEELAATPREQWPQSRIDAISEQPPANLGGVPLKYVFGSDHPYRQVDEWHPLTERGASTHATFAKGGFSTVWGAAVLPYTREDLADWPVGADELGPHYRAVHEWMPFSARRDDLDESLPLAAPPADALDASAQAQAVMAHFEAHRDGLRRAGFRFGFSRLAVRAAADERGPGCIRCGLCISGCPHGLIYDAAQTLAALQRDERFDYRPGLVVERLEERGDEVTLRARRLGDRSPETLRASRVYVACGPIGTTRLVLSSLDRLDHCVRILDSQYFLLPLLGRRWAADVRNAPLHTLSQLFLELRDDRVSSHNVHMQLYGFNELYVKLIEGPLGPLRRPLAPLVGQLLDRLLLIQGYLHSNESPAMDARLVRRDGREVLEVEGVANPLARPVLRRVVTRLLRSARGLGAVAGAPALQVAPPGRGFHSGGSFPMAAAPSGLQSDVLGRPAGLRRVHLVDSSVFPTIPSTTITYSVMANAHRIASTPVD